MHGEGEGHEEDVVGVRGQYVRLLDGLPMVDTNVRWCTGILAKFEAWFISHQHKRCVIDCARLAALEASLTVDHVQCFDILDWWYLSRLVVDSQCKDRGAETLLVQWGTLKADAESL